MPKLEKRPKSPPRNAHPKLRFPHDFGLSLVLLGLFLALATAQTFVGHAALNSDLQQHGMPPISYPAYFHTGICWESLSENWESEFLEMGAFVWLTSFLYQRGSPESDDPDQPSRHEKCALTPRSPWPARRGGWIRALYSRSLSLAFLVLFLISFAIHALAGTGEYNRQQLLHGQPAVSAWQFLGTSNFWFQSLQNWQSEFLGIASMVLLSIWLRQERSAESKPVNAPHVENE
jgi:hypothetical protein